MAQPALPGFAEDGNQLETYGGIGERVVGFKRYDAFIFQVNAEKLLHFDWDYHYNLGLSQRIMGISMSPKDVDYMEGHSLHFALRYDITKRLPAGAGTGIDAYPGTF